MPSARQQNYKHVFYAWFVLKVYKGQQRSFASSCSGEAVSQGHEAVMDKSAECSAVQFRLVKS
jgi:hypothetical protein